MSDAGIRITIWLNQIANSIGQAVLWPIGVLPELAGAILVAVVTGIVMLVGFKYTSNQTAVKRVRSRIKAELLSLSLFKDSVAVSLRSQGRILVAAMQSVLFSLPPIVCMIVPVTLLLGQLSLWWQVRPLHKDEDAVVTLNLSGNEQSVWPDVRLRPTTAVACDIGPVKVQTKRAICWNLQAKESGYHDLVFDVGDQPVVKQLAVGDHPMRVSVRRPEWNWSQILLHPAETPFDSQSPIKSIEIQYPTRSSWATGANSWLIFWFAVSMLAAFCFRGVFKVSL